MLLRWSVYNWNDGAKFSLYAAGPGPAKYFRSCVFCGWRGGRTGLAQASVNWPSLVATRHAQLEGPGLFDVPARASSAWGRAGPKPADKGAWPGRGTLKVGHWPFEWPEAAASPA